MNLYCKFIQNLGRVSKQLLDPILETVRERSGLLQFKNTISVLSLFQAIQEKRKYNFLQFDIKSWYPSITEKLLRDTFTWAEQFCDISDRTKNIVMQMRKTFLVFGMKK